MKELYPTHVCSELPCLQIYRLISPGWPNKNKAKCTDFHNGDLD